MELSKVHPVLEPLAAVVSQELGGDLVSLALFGSVLVPDDYQPGLSDINTLVVLRDGTGAGSVRKLRKAFDAFRKHPFAQPLVFKERELRDACDVFAVELVEMQENHRVLAGGDPLALLPFDKTDIRRQCEAEVRTKLLGLRRMLFAEDELSKHPRFLLKSLTSSIVLFKQALRLRGMELPSTRTAVLEALETAFGRRFDGTAQLYQMRLSGQRPSAAALGTLLDAYLADLEFFGSLFNEAV